VTRLKKKKNELKKKKKKHTQCVIESFIRVSLVRCHPGPTLALPPLPAGRREPFLRRDPSARVPDRGVKPGREQAPARAEVVRNVGNADGARAAVPREVARGGRGGGDKVVRDVVQRGEGLGGERGLRAADRVQELRYDCLSFW
jgi:hypothetical protein